MSRIQLRRSGPIDEKTFDLLLREFFSHATLGEDGRVSWSSVPFHDYELALLGCIDFPSGLSGDARRTIISDASRYCVRKGTQDREAFVAALVQVARKRHETRPEKCTILTKLSCHAPSENLFIRLRDAKVTIHHRTPRGFNIARSVNGVEPAEPLPYAFASVAVEGKTYIDKFERALIGLTVFGGLLNLSLTFGTFALFPTLSRLPLRRVCFGKYFVLYNADRSRHESNWHYIGDDELVSSTQMVSANMLAIHFGRAQTLYRWLQRHPLSRELEAALRQYQGALEADAVDNALTRMWSALERVVLISEKQDRSETIRRAAGFFEDSHICKAQLIAVSDERNRAVHRGEHDDFGVSLVEACKRTFDVVFLSLLKNKMKLRTKAEFIEFLSWPHDEKDVRNKMRIWRKRARFLQGSSRKNATG